MFMTTKTHDRIVAEEIMKALAAETARREKFAEYDLMNCQKSFRAQLSITEAQRAQINDMQHFYNKGRAVHAADVRYEAKKRAEKIKVNVL